MPEVYEPVPGEVVAYGLFLENSDFGNGALSVRAFLLRIWCTNLAITQEEMRQVHLGKRLDESMIYSERTYGLDAKHSPLSRNPRRISGRNFAASFLGP